MVYTIGSHVYKVISEAQHVLHKVHNPHPRQHSHVVKVILVDSYAVHPESQHFDTRFTTLILGNIHM